MKPTGSSLPMFVSSAIWAIFQVDSPTSERTAVRRARSGVPRSGRPSMPKIPAMITSSVIACMRGASANASPTGQRSISRSAAAEIISA